MNAQAYKIDDPELTERKVRDALKWIEPSNHDDRVTVAMAMQSAFGGNDAYWSMFDEWYQTYDRYDASESRDIWKSTRPGPIGIGTLFKLAKDRGWRWVDHDERSDEQRQADQKAAQKRAEQAAIDRAREAAKKAEKAVEAAEKVSRVMSASTPASASNGYLTRKQVDPAGDLAEISLGELRKIIGYTPKAKPKDGEPVGERVYLRGGSILIVPYQVPNESGELERSTIEMIDESGHKSYLAGGRKTGSFFLSDPLPGPDAPEDERLVMVCEGVATCLSLRAATGRTVVGVGGVTNFRHVLGWLRQRKPWVTPVVCPDVLDVVKLKGGETDTKDPLGTRYAARIDGLIDKSVIRAIREHQTCCAVPWFRGERVSGLTDFNDLAVTAGLDKVRERVEMGVIQGNFGSGSNREDDQEQDKVSGSVLTEEMRDILDRYGHIIIGEKPLVVYKGIDDDENIQTMFTSLSAFSSKLSNKRAFKELQIKTNAYEHWRNSRERKEYDQLTFRPIAGKVADNEPLPEMMVTNDYGVFRLYNLYEGLSFDPETGKDKSCDLILKHIREVWCNNNIVSYNYVLDWFARMFQYPNEPGGTCIVLSGGQGTGKDTIVDIFKKAFGQHAFMANTPDKLVGRFNKYVSTSVFVFANEATWGGDKALEGALKTLITDTNLPCERKGIDTYSVKNCTHVLVASNNEWIVPVGEDDRRFFVLDVSSKYQNDHAYFKRLRHERDNGGAEAFVYMLHNRPISNFDPHSMPENNSRAKLDMKIRTANSIVRWWIECVEEGRIMGTVERAGSRVRVDLASGYPGTFSGQSWDDGNIVIRSDELLDAYRDWCRAAGMRMESSTAFGRKLHSMCSIRKVRTRTEKEREYRYVLPSLSLVRASMDQVLRQPGPWHDFEDQC